MKLEFMITISKQKPNLRFGSQKCHTDQKKKNIASSVQCESDADFIFWLWGCNSSWISTSWPDGAQGLLSEDDEERQWGEEGLICGGGKQLLDHDEAPVHSSLLIHDSVTKRETMRVPQPLHSPNLAPADFFFLTKLKSVLKGQFESVEEIKENSLAELRNILKEAFQESFQNWKKHWARYIKSGGEYFEGDKAQWLLSKWENNLFKLFGFFVGRLHMMQVQQKGFWRVGKALVILLQLFLLIMLHNLPRLFNTAYSVLGLQVCNFINSMSSRLASYTCEWESLDVFQSYKHLFCSFISVAPCAYYVTYNILCLVRRHTIMICVIVLFVAEW